VSEDPRDQYQPEAETVENQPEPPIHRILPDELRPHKEQWLKICREHPETLVSAIRNADVGPLQALIDELDFNATAGRSNHHNIQDGVFHEHHCRFHEHKFLRAIHERSISFLRDEIRKLLLEAYRAMGAANVAIEAKSHHEINSEGWATGCHAVARLVVDARPKITKARDELLRFLAHESGSEPFPHADGSKKQ
jgi:hypothetical protein